MTTVATQEAALTTAALKTEVRIAKSFRAGTESAAYEADVLVQLKSNLAQLEDMHGRLKFLMGELSYLMKRS